MEAITNVLLHIALTPFLLLDFVDSSTRTLKEENYRLEQNITREYAREKYENKR